MILSNIDIGTNTILMLTAEAAADGSIRVLGDEHEIARLGKGVDATRTILPETFDRVEGYLARYKEIARSLGAERIVAFGTSALRDARNQREFIDAMRERVGIEIEVLDGPDEALYTFLGATVGLSGIDETRVVLDIGGGSTEVALGTGDRLTAGRSLDIGAVRLTERYLRSLPPSPAELTAARNEVGSELASLYSIPENCVAVGVAGTVTTLGAIEMGLARFDAEELNGFSLSRDAIARLAERLTTSTLEQILAIEQVPAGRADVLPGGAIILDEFMRRYDLPRIIVSTRGVRYGVFLREAVRKE